MKKRILSILCIFFIMIMAGCMKKPDGQSRGNNTRQTPPIEAELDGSTEEYPASSKDNFVILNYTADVLAMDAVHANDPEAGTVRSVLFDSLMYLDADGNLTPGLATSWEQIGETAYQFKLREGVTFHNGQKFTAEDVKYTFDTHLDPAVQSATYLVWSNEHLVPVKEVTVVDDYTVTIELFSSSGIIYNMMHMFSEVLPRGYPLEKMKEHPIGTGPYKFVKYDRGDKIVLTKNEAYWRSDIPKIKNLVFKILPIENSIENWLEAIVAGDVDFIMHLPGRFRRKIEADVNTHIMERAVFSSIWISLRNKGPLRDVRVRKALNYAVNKEGLIKYAEYGKGEIIASIGRKGEFGYNETLKPYTYDIQQAKELMKEAGYEDGCRFHVIATDVTENVMKLIKEDLKDINVELDLEIISTLEYIKRAPFMAKILNTEPSDCDIAVLIVDNPVRNILFNCDTLLLSSISHIAHTEYNYPEYEEKHNWANVSDPVEHEKRLKELDAFIHENAYFIFTYQRVLTSAIRNNIHMKKLNINGHLEFEMLTETTKE
jgi:peptide/nickel transport system substrate-binding protein